VTVGGTLAPGRTPPGPLARRLAEGGEGASARERALAALPLAGPCALAALLCAWELGKRSLWIDEGATVAIVSQHGAALWAAIAHDGGNMLAYYLLMHVVVGLFGTSTTVLRVPSLLATVATVWLVALLARELFDRRVALAAALLAAVSLPLVFWGQDARGYAPLITFLTASFYFFARIVQRPAPAPRRLLIAYGACTALAAYMQLVAALVVPAQALVLVIRREHAGAILRTLALTALACLPLMALAALRGAGQLFWVPGPSIVDVGQTARWLTSSGMPPNFHARASANALLAATLVLLAAPVLVLAERLRAGWGELIAQAPGAWRRGDVLALALAFGWIAMPLALSVLESLTGQPILLYRNSVVALPAVAILIAWSLLRTRLPPVAGWAAVVAILGLRAVQVLPAYGLSPENWKAAEAYVLASARPGDCIAFYPLDGRMPFDYYVRARGQELGAPLPVDPATPWYRVKPFVEQYAVPPRSALRRIESACPRLWFIASHQGQLHGTPGSLTNYIRYRILQDELQSAYAHDRTRRFGWAAVVYVELLSGHRPGG
jgi:mannosyltransferase